MEPPVAFAGRNKDPAVLQHTRADPRYGNIGFREEGNIQGVHRLSVFIQNVQQGGFHPPEIKVLGVAAEAEALLLGPFRKIDAFFKGIGKGGQPIPRFCQDGYKDPVIHNGEFVRHLALRQNTVIYVSGLQVQAVKEGGRCRCIGIQRVIFVLKKQVVPPGGNIAGRGPGQAGDILRPEQLHFGGGIFQIQLV